jgi:hypothetical protein
VALADQHLEVLVLVRVEEHHRDEVARVPEVRLVGGRLVGWLVGWLVGRG